MVKPGENVEDQGAYGPAVDRNIVVKRQEYMMLGTAHKDISHAGSHSQGGLV